MKKISVIILCILILFTSVTANGLNLAVTDVENNITFDESLDYNGVDCSVAVDAELMTFAKSVVLMEKSTGRVLYSENENEKVFPASVTKIMSILLVCEALESGKITLEDKVTCSDNASSKGGSQIWLEPGETMTVHELLKATCVYSANDACTLLGEYVAGSETAFNQLMNKRAKELGMKNTHFDNCTGLDDTTDTHLTTAYDIAVMSRELIKYDFIKEYTTIWMDSLRNGETQLVNTNKLVRFYDGITGLKTGTTDKAGCCVAATAERNGMELIAVVMGSENSKDRFNSAQNMLDWGFANYELFVPVIPSDSVKTISVDLGVKDEVNVLYPEIPSVLINKGKSDKIKVNIITQDGISAPVTQGQKVGVIQILSGEKILSECDITAEKAVEKLTFFTAMHKILSSL
ncbi:MAG: D-alanyl-D-alanine carboxypeptidase [Clostridia bacterium]|nr:D-alanyl-D-alanine carboxypeptidase [Clostridia bacterium]